MPSSRGPRRSSQSVAGSRSRRPRRQGASQCEADARLSRGLSVTVRLGEVDTVEYQRDRGLGVTVYFGKRKGSASTADLSRAAVRETVRQGVRDRALHGRGEYAGLVEPEELAREIPDLDLDHPWEHRRRSRPSSWRASARRPGSRCDARLSNSEGATVSSHTSARVYGNRLGFLAGYS